MLQRIEFFQADESGQDIVEYSLLVCFVALASMWLLGSGQPAINSIWRMADTRLTSANTAAS